MDKDTKKALEKALERGGAVGRANYEAAPEEVKKFWHKDYWDLTDEEKEILKRWNDEKDAAMPAEELEKRERWIAKYLETHPDEYPKFGRPAGKSAKVEITDEETRKFAPDAPETELLKNERERIEQIKRDAPYLRVILTAAENSAIIQNLEEHLEAERNLTKEGKEQINNIINFLRKKPLFKYNGPMD